MSTTGIGEAQVTKLKMVQAANVPAILLSGAVAGDPQPLFRHFAAVLSIAAGPGPLPEAIADAPANLTRAAQSLAAVMARSGICR
jgi:glycerate kinase